MSRITEAVSYIEHSLETVLIECDRINEPASAFGIAQVLKDIRMLKTGLLPIAAVMDGCQLSTYHLERRVRGLGRMGEW